MTKINSRAAVKYSLIAIGALLLVNAFAVAFGVGVNAGTVLTALLGAVLVLFGVFSCRLHRAIRVSFWILLTLGVLLAAFLPIYGSFDSVTYGEDAMIVLGAGLNREEPSHTLKLRLDTAYDYALKNPDALIVVSGGQGKNEVIAESLAMKRYLVKKGVAEERIIEEARSMSTRENLTFSKALLDERFDKPYRIVVVSNDYHIYRAERIAEDLGWKNVTHTSGATPLTIAIPSYLRECAAVLRLWLFGI